MSQQRFKKKLAEQAQFLEASCRAYDSGAEIEGFRIAVSLRVLFHQTILIASKSRGSISLITHLGMQDCKVLATVPTHANFTSFVRIQISLGSPQPIRAIPKLGDRFHPLPLNQWWDKQVVVSANSRNYTRRDLLLQAANKDGGAHVDEKLDEFYEALASGAQTLAIDASKLQFTGEAPFNQSQMQYCQNLHLAMIRQFGHEVLASVGHFGWLKPFSS